MAVKTGWAIVFAVSCTLLMAGVVFLAVSPRRGAPVVLSAPPSPEPVMVHVVGAVVKPGVYQLPPGSHVQDAIAKAGGLGADADGETLNQAALVMDGQQILVPARRVEQTTEPQVVETGVPERAQVVQVAQSGLININTASQAELESLPAIGPALAKRIIAYREAHGPFPSIEKIVDVAGIGPATFKKIETLITVENIY